MAIIQTRVREVAEQQGLTMYALQKKSGVSMGTVRRYWYNTSDGKEYGPPLKVVFLDQFGLIATALDTTPGELIEELEENE